MLERTLECCGRVEYKTRPVDGVYRIAQFHDNYKGHVLLYFICDIKKNVFFAIVFSSTCQKPMDYLFDQVASDQEFTEKPEQDQRIPLNSWCFSLHAFLFPSILCILRWWSFSFTTRSRVHQASLCALPSAANAAADRVAINAIVNEAADTTADQVAVNATIVNVAAHTVTGRVAAISDEAERGA